MLLSIHRSFQIGLIFIIAVHWHKQQHGFLSNPAKRLNATVVSEKEKTICKLLKILASSGCDNHLVSNCLHAQSLLLTTDQNRRQFFLDKGAAVVGAMCIRNPGQLLFVHAPFCACLCLQVLGLLQSISVNVKQTEIFCWKGCHQ